MDVRSRSRLGVLALVAVILMSLVPMGTVNAAPNAATITVMPVTTAPEAFEVPIRIATLPTGGLESFRLILDIPSDLTIIGATKTGTAMDGGLIQYSVSGNQITVAGAIATPINTANSVIAKLQLEILQITNDIEYTISGTGRVNEVDLAPGGVTSGIARIEMVDLTGTLTSWDGKDVAGADVSLTGPTTSLATTTNSGGTYSIRVGKVENQEIVYSWNELIDTDTYVGEQDASEALKTSVGTANCPVLAGDVTDNGEVTEQDAARFLQIALDPASYTPTPTFVPNNIVLPHFNTDAVHDAVSYILGDCSGNYSWLAGVTGGMVMSISAPTATVAGDTITLQFPGADSTKFYLNGLPEDAKLEVRIFDEDRSPETSGMIATRDNIIVAAVADPGFVLEVKVTSATQQTVEVNLRGRINESPYSEWDAVDVTPSQLMQFLYLPSVTR